MQRVVHAKLLVWMRPRECYSPIAASKAIKDDKKGVFFNKQHVWQAFASQATGQLKLYDTPPPPLGSGVHSLFMPVILFESLSLSLLFFLLVLF